MFKTLKELKAAFNQHNACYTCSDTFKNFIIGRALATLYGGRVFLSKKRAFGSPKDYDYCLYEINSNANTIQSLAGTGFAFASRTKAEELAEKYVDGAALVVVSHKHHKYNYFGSLGKPYNTIFIHRFKRDTIQTRYYDMSQKNIERFLPFVQNEIYEDLSRTVYLWEPCNG